MCQLICRSIYKIVRKEAGLILIGHSSDEHGNYSQLINNDRLPDVWFLTGDFLPNGTRGDRAVEVPFQTQYLEQHLDELRDAFYGRPVLVVPGNHDFIDVVPILQQNGILALRVGVKKQSIELAGQTWTYAGFREIPYIAGEWAGESDSATLTGLVNEIFEDPPDLLCTHAPPAGIMDGTGRVEYGQIGYGIPHLTSRLMYSDHKIQLHCFGHQHWCSSPDRQEVHNRIIFSNAATTLNFIELP